MTEIFSKRHNILKSGEDDVYVYNKLSKRFCNQIYTLLLENETLNNELSEEILKNLCFERGDKILKECINEYYTFTGTIRVISSVYTCPYKEILLTIFLMDSSYDRKLDSLELICFQLNYKKDYFNHINKLFKENSIGYRINEETGLLLRYDSEFTHSEIIKPTILLLTDSRFKNAEEEFLKAHNFYRQGKGTYKNCIDELIKSIESVFKIIFGLKGWEFDSNAPLKTLIKIAFEKKLFNKSQEDYWNNLQGILMGLGTIGNKNSRHGQGEETKEISEALVGFVMNTVASALLYSYQSFKD